MNARKQISLFELDTFFVLLIAFMLRFYGFWDWSLTNDELSALMRTKFNSIGELIKEGVWVDGHPALTQVFLYYWKQLAGDSVFALRIPFVAMSCIGTVYFYLFSKKVLHKNTALIALSLLSVSQLFILYAQIARPYSMGFFFTMSFAYYWYSFIQKPKFNANFWLLILFGLFGALSHYFSSLSILILLISGLFIVEKKSIPLYSWALLILFLLYTPHLPITFNHLSIGGVEWLAEPKADYIFFFLKLAFNESYLFEFLGFCCLLMPFFFNPLIQPKKQIGLAAFFIANYLIAYYYSIYKSPVIQYSVFIFSFPFFLLFLSSFFSKNLKLKYIRILSFIILLLGVLTLIFKANFYSHKKFPNFQAIIEDAIIAKKEYGKENLLALANANRPEYLNYYIEQQEVSFQYDLSQFSAAEDIVKARDLIENSSKKYLLASFANTPIPFEVHEYAKLKYQKIAKQNRYFNSETMIYELGDQSRAQLFSTNYLDFEENTKWRVSPEKIQDSTTGRASPAYLMSAHEEYILNYKDSIKNLFDDQNKFLTIKAMIKAEVNQDFVLVVSVSRNEKNIVWKGTHVLPFLTSDKWVQFISVFQKTEEIKENDIISIYFWNPEKSKAYISNFEIINYQDSDYNYYELIQNVLQ